MQQIMASIAKMEAQEAAKKQAAKKEVSKDPCVPKGVTVAGIVLSDNPGDRVRQHKALTKVVQNLKQPHVLEPGGRPGSSGANTARARAAFTAPSTELVALAKGG